MVTGPVLLTGLAVCASCHGAMTLRTGTSKTGQVHRYYTCSTCVRHGKTVCKGRSIRMDKLDGEADDDQIRIIGRKDVREQAVRAGGAPPPAIRSLVFPSRERGDSSFRAHGLHNGAFCGESKMPWQECNPMDERL
ncbi:MAG: zinc ribbon domain-containing protein, partial [Hyphomicrobiaceae bacterium]